MMDRVDLDEKWFYISREKDSYILIAGNEEGDGEEDVYRSAKKLHLKMVMFLCAVGWKTRNVANWRICASREVQCEST
jgi:hypothetical protein